MESTKDVDGEIVSVQNVTVNQIPDVGNPSLSSSSTSTSESNELRPEPDINMQQEIELQTRTVPNNVPDTYQPNVNSSNNNLSTTNSVTNVNYQISVLNDAAGSNVNSSNNDLSTTNSVANINYQITNNNYLKDKWMKFTINSYFFSRIILLILSIFVFILCISSCIAQFVNVELDLITECDKPKSRKEIWQHSFEASLKNNGQLNENAYESQYGHTSDPCFSTRRIEINTHRLWYSNYYVAVWESNINAKVVLFALVSIYCLIIISYNIATLIIDITNVCKNTLHTKSQYYQQFVAQQQGNTKPKNKESAWRNRWANMKTFHQKYLGTDQPLWVIQMILFELIEIIIQTNALLFYNGYYNDDKNIYLAKKPEFIILFATFITINCFGSAFLWAFYAIIPQCCNGLTFKLALLCLDQMSDLLYSVFPFVAVIYDEYTYNSNSNSFILLLGQFSTNSSLVFIAALTPLVLLCNKHIIMVINLTNEVRNIWFNEWKALVTITKTSNNSNASKNIKDEMFDHNGQIIDTLQKIDTKINKANCLRSENNRIRYMKKISLLFITVFYICCGIVILSLTVKSINESKDYCNSVKESKLFENGIFMNDSHALGIENMRLLQSHPELLLWDRCLYKVYPFLKNKEWKCQCRVFVVDDWKKLNSTSEQRRRYLNITQQNIFEGALTHWTMLEKFRSDKGENDFNEEYEISDAMTHTPHLKALQISFAKLSLPSDISAWKSLNYLKLEDNKLESLPFGLKYLTKLKYLSFTFNELNTFPNEICNISQLKVLDLQWNYIETVPFCVGELNELKQLLFDGNIVLTNIPISIFNLSNLIDLGLFRTNFNYLDFLDYNLPINIDLNDTISIDIWFKDSFNWNNLTTFWLALTPICDQQTNFASKLGHFVNNIAICDYKCTNGKDSFCSPLVLGDGRCDQMCNIEECYFDFGDCLQLCFAKEYSNCTWNLYNNSVCDDECNNKYCQQYYWNSDFTEYYTATESDIVKTVYGADLHHCVENSSTQHLDIRNCDNSVSTYLDYPVRHTSNDLCDWLDWIGDGTCDDMCRTDECIQDAGDCELGCFDDICSQIYKAWTFAVGTAIYLDHQNVCEKTLSLAPFLLGREIFNGSVSICLNNVAEFDYNNDKYMNFREFVPFSKGLFQGYEYDTFGMGDPYKRFQINCSSCIGMEYYNVRHTFDEEEEILAAKGVCWSAHNLNHDKFNAPMNGTISAVRLVHQFGGILCNDSSASIWKTNIWGCGTTMNTQLLHINDGKIYYPRNNITDDVSNVDYCIDIDGCEYISYNMMPYVAPYDIQFVWRNPTYNVTTNDQFILVDGNACCQKNQNIVGDENNIVCADIYFLYTVN